MRSLLISILEAAKDHQDLKVIRETMDLKVLSEMRVDTRAQEEQGIQGVQGEKGDEGDTGSQGEW